MSQTSGEMTQSGMKDWTETQSGIMTIAGVTRDTLTDMMSAEIETALSFACPLQLTTVFLQRGRKSDRSEDGYLSDGDYQEQDYKMELGEEESKAIMLRGLSLQIWAALEQLQGPQLVDIRLMKKRTSAPGVKALIATAAGVVMSQTAQVYQHHLLSQPAIQMHQLVRQIDVTPQAATSSLKTAATLAAPTGVAPFSDSICVRHRPTSLQQQKPHNSCRLQLRTGLFSSLIKQIIQGEEGQAQEQVFPAAKDLECWANSLNKQKKSFKSSFLGYVNELLCVLLLQHGGGFETQLVKNELVKKGEPETPAKSSLVAVYSGGSDPEEAADPDQGIGGDERSDKLTDWRKMTCLLCLRQFPSEDALLLVHQQLQTCRMASSKQDDTLIAESGWKYFGLFLALPSAHGVQLSFSISKTIQTIGCRAGGVGEKRYIELKYRDRAAERRDNYGVPEPPAPKKKKFYQT
ncbi:hypothetical protein J4Q44_G00083030 [Coregonus suidteri]|uniref:Uncharacterized protein n=1 Tax=Coregonus suidteri TaxID=861788 RepID=A0AAN8M8D9_9TELE